MCWGCDNAPVVVRPLDARAHGHFHAKWNKNDANVMCTHRRLAKTFGLCMHQNANAAAAAATDVAWTVLRGLCGWTSEEVSENWLANSKWIYLSYPVRPEFLTQSSEFSELSKWNAHISTTLTACGGLLGGDLQSMNFHCSICIAKRRYRIAMPHKMDFLFQFRNLDISHDPLSSSPFDSAPTCFADRLASHKI